MGEGEGSGTTEGMGEWGEMVLLKEWVNGGGSQVAL